jgi:16S rRNA (cytosine1402-N4)-methyltransferase
MPSLAATTLFKTEMEMAHQPVLTKELEEVLGLRRNAVVVDCTYGAGGHAQAVAAHLGPDGVLVGIDQDPLGEEYYYSQRPGFRCRSRFMLGNNADCLADLAAEGFKATAIYMDLGVSSMQIDTPERGFSYSYDAPLDMRMDPEIAVTAADIVNTWSEADLAHLFSRYGEERYSRRIARAIVFRRQRQAYTRTCELVDTIKSAIPTPARFAAGNPAKRVFQALRIEVNDELNSLRRALPLAFSLLEPGVGVLAVITFHSLEDRMVKEFCVGRVKACTCPPEFPVCVCGGKATGELVTTKPVTPSAHELELNPRSSSAKLRAIRRI